MPARLDAGASPIDLPAGSLAWSDDDGADWQVSASGGAPLRAWWLTLEIA